MTATQIIASLNSLHVGQFDTIQARLEQARQACLGLELEELALKLEEAGTALRGADLKTYRKRVETVVARLGHLR
jgi:hypothetical protein